MVFKVILGMLVRQLKCANHMAREDYSHSVEDEVDAATSDVCLRPATLSSRTDSAPSSRTIPSSEPSSVTLYERQRGAQGYARFEEDLRPKEASFAFDSVIYIAQRHIASHLDLVLFSVTMGKKILGGEIVVQRRWSGRSPCLARGWT